jgi:endonuclease-8
MEGPSLKVVADSFLRFEGDTVLSASGNAKITMDDLVGQRIGRIYTIGKLLFLGLERISVKIHFLMFGSYRIDEKREGMKPRLSLRCESGEVHFYNRAIRTIVNEDVAQQFDEELDIVSPQWRPGKVLAFARNQKKEFICDVLLDQNIFGAVGNIIKNEALFQALVHPLSVVGKIPPEKLEQLSQETRTFSRQLYETRKNGESMGDIQRIYRKKLCPLCGEKVTTQKTGHRQRRSHFCPRCQVLYSRTVR